MSFPPGRAATVTHHRTSAARRSELALPPRRASFSSRRLTPPRGQEPGMPVGLMVGPERGRYATKVERLVADAQWADENGLATIWIPQVPDDFDALTAVAMTGDRTSRVEIGTAVVPVQPRHPIALAQQALSTQAVCGGRLTLGLGVSHHWVIYEMLGLPYEHPAATMRAYLDVLDPA